MLDFLHDAFQVGLDGPLALCALCPAGAKPAETFAKRNVDVNRNWHAGVQIPQRLFREVGRNTIVKLRRRRVTSVPGGAAGVDAQLGEYLIIRHMREIDPPAK